MFISEVGQIDKRRRARKRKRSPPSVPTSSGGTLGGLLLRSCFAFPKKPLDIFYRPLTYPKRCAIINGRGAEALINISLTLYKIKVLYKKGNPKRPDLGGFRLRLDFQGFCRVASADFFAMTLFAREFQRRRFYGGWFVRFIRSHRTCVPRRATKIF